MSWQPPSPECWACTELVSTSLFLSFILFRRWSSRLLMIWLQLLSAVVYWKSLLQCSSLVLTQSRRQQSAQAVGCSSRMPVPRYFWEGTLVEPLLAGAQKCTDFIFQGFGKNSSSEIPFMVDKEVRPPDKLEQLDCLVVCLRRDCWLPSPDIAYTASCDSTEV